MPTLSLIQRQDLPRVGLRYSDFGYVEFADNSTADWVLSEPYHEIHSKQITAELSNISVKKMEYCKSQNHQTPIGYQQITSTNRSPESSNCEVSSLWNQYSIQESPIQQTLNSNCLNAYDPMFLSFNLGAAPLTPSFGRACFQDTNIGTFPDFYVKPSQQQYKPSQRPNDHLASRNGPIHLNTCAKSRTTKPIDRHLKAKKKPFKFFSKHQSPENYFIRAEKISTKAIRDAKFGNLFLNLMVH